jgi:hypothetical protein
MRHFLVASLALAVSASPIATPPKLMPVDEARKEPALAGVRDEVLAAVRARDARRVMSFVSPAVVLDGAAQKGDANWRSLDRALANPRQEDWRRLEDSLALGGAFTTKRGANKGRREFCAPYVFAAFPEHLPLALRGLERSPWVIVDKHVEVHSSADESSRVIASLSYSIVPANGGEYRDPHDAARTWQAINVSAGEDGFVDSRKIRNPEGYHVCFAKEGGSWLISSIAQRSAPGARRLADSAAADDCLTRPDANESGENPAGYATARQRSAPRSDRSVQH